MNKAILIGRLTKDVIAQQTQQGTTYLFNTIAVQRDFKNQNGEYDTDFINFVAHRQTAELIAKHFKKGDRIGLVGRWQVRTYTNNDNINVYVNELVVNEIEFLQEKKEQPQAQAQQPNQYQQPQPQQYNQYQAPNQYQGQYQQPQQPQLRQQYQPPKLDNVTDEDLPF